jgi:hypothetical protein
MRPPKSVLEAAIRNAPGNITRASVLLGCSRETLYRWVYQLGLEKFAGIEPKEGSDSYDKESGRDTSDSKKQLSTVSSDENRTSRLRLVSTIPAQREYKVPATVRLNEALWKAIRKEAIDRGCTVSELVERTLAASLEKPTTKAKRKDPSQ